ncbi:MAG TPA: hypothetical protein VFD48_06365, partial [Pyrinomonadaceae bacterium]|nr:hypothetical protein [Pyrinomonadaceae bacterium]
VLTPTLSMGMGMAAAADAKIPAAGHEMESGIKEQIKAQPRRLHHRMVATIPQSILRPASQVFRRHGWSLAWAHENSVNGNLYLTN